MKVVKFILAEKNFNPNHIDSEGKNAIHYVVNPVEYGSYENVEILELLKAAKISLSVKDNSG